jgi:hypothetical protein
MLSRQVTSLWIRKRLVFDAYSLLICGLLAVGFSV